MNARALVVLILLVCSLLSAIGLTARPHGDRDQITAAVALPRL